MLPPLCPLRAITTSLTSSDLVDRGFANGRMGLPVEDVDPCAKAAISVRLPGRGKAPWAALTPGRRCGGPFARDPLPLGLRVPKRARKPPVEAELALPETLTNRRRRASCLRVDLPNQLALPAFVGYGRGSRGRPSGHGEPKAGGIRHAADRIIASRRPPAQVAAASSVIRRKAHLKSPRGSQASQVARPGPRGDPAAAGSRHWADRGHPV